MNPDEIFNLTAPHQPLPAKAGTPYADAFLIMKYPGCREVCEIDDKESPLTMNLPQGNPPLPGRLLPPREEREKEFLAFVPRVARSEPDWPTSQPWAKCRHPFGVMRFGGSMREISFRRILTPALSPLLRRGEREKVTFLRFRIAGRLSSNLGTHQ